MAAVANFENVQKNNLLKFQNFKEAVQQKLEWQYKDWINSEFCNSELHGFVKRCKYWFSNLKEVSNDKFLVISLYMEGLQLQITPRQILLEFKRQFGIRGLKGFSVARNSSFIVLYFDSTENRNYASENFRFVSDFVVVNSDWFVQGDTLEFKLLWLPPVVDIVIVNEKLAEYVEVVEVQNETCDLCDEDVLPSGKFFGKIKLTDKFKLEDIPHIMVFEEYEGLLVIPKRKVLCLNCLELGHISKRCPKPFCSNCQEKLPRGHKCFGGTIFRSYAEVVSLDMGATESTRLRKNYSFSVEGGWSMNTHNLMNKVGDRQWGDDPGETSALADSLKKNGSLSAPSVLGKTEFMDVNQSTYKRPFDQVSSRNVVELVMEGNPEGASENLRRQSSRVKIKNKDGKGDVIKTS